jgi:hypothetical protein
VRRGRILHFRKENFQSCSSVLLTFLKLGLWRRGPPFTSWVRQGDPLGPALFCLSAQTIALSLQSELRVLYLDDATLLTHLLESAPTLRR